MLICPICQCQDGIFQQLETDCLFLPIEGLDQHLVRHRCPSCGVIFGTQQMLNLSKEKLGNAYKQLFDTGYRDGGESTIECEIFDLMTLNPNKDGVYLNWGAQVSTAPDRAKAKGYTLFNYDPFISENLLTNFITTEQINQMKFDGIISHNLIEHLQHPIDDLKLMRSLLKPDAMMVHSTECYKYKFEFTKYHMFFFEGKSLDVICEKVGLTHEFIPNDKGTEVVRFSQK